MSTDRHERAGFDREINVRAVIWSGVALVAVALVVHLLIWWLLHGFSVYDQNRDVRLTPIEVANPQPPPPEPRLQTDPNADMRRLRQQEDAKLSHAAWVNRQQGTVRVPIDVAIEVIAGRGVTAEVVGGKPSAAAPPPIPAPPPAP